MKTGRPFSRRQFIASVSLGATALFSTRQPGAVAEKQKRPNILLIVSEDNGQELSCYGDNNVHTPHLDRLAADGMRFENAYVTQAVCSPSRSTFFTGLYPHQNGQLGLATHSYAMFKDWGTSYQRLKKAGYTTGLLGKTHVNPKRYVEDWVDYRQITGSNFAKKDLAAYAQHADEFIEQADGRPFFLTVNFPDAHWPVQNTVEGRPRKPLTPDQVKPMPFIAFDNPRIREHIAGYYNCMLRLDECVGELIGVLRKSGTLDNTLIIYIGDHGAQMARGKVGVLEGSTRIPFIVRWPGVAQPGAVSKALVSTIDLLPTFLDAANAPAAPDRPGKSLRSLLQGEVTDDSFREYLFTERNCDSSGLHYPQRTIRDRRHKLILTLLPGRPDPAATSYLTHRASHWRGSPTPEELEGTSKKIQAIYATYRNPPRIQLYDLQEDPWEFDNLVGQPDHETTQERLHERLRQWQRETLDPMTDPALLEKLTEENDACVEAAIRAPKGGWKYLDYLHPDKILGNPS